jgi:hypothetical protein
MRGMLAIVLVVISFAGMGCAGPNHGLQANDTGGIIPWTPETDLTYREIAGEYCARRNRIAHITSVHREYGDYIGFVCIYDRQYDPRKAWLSQ